MNWYNFLYYLKSSCDFRGKGDIQPVNIKEEGQGEEKTAKYFHNKSNSNNTHFN